MCARVDQNGNVIDYLPRFKRKADADKKRFNIGIGQPAYFVTNTLDVVEGIFGYVPKWAKEVKQIYYNARTEGDLNPTDDTNYNGHMGIFEKPSFRDAIKTSRCIVPVSAFYEGPEVEKLKKPFRIYSTEEPVIYLAGLCGTHYDPKKELEIIRFSVLTTPAIPVTAGIGHHRCPLMLNEDFIETWLDSETSLDDIEAIMRERWQPEGMASLAIDPLEIKKTSTPVPPKPSNTNTLLF